MEFSAEELEIIQKIILVILQVAIPPLVGYILVQWKKRMEVLQSDETWIKVQEAVADAVRAAEQLGLTDQLKEYGDSKLEFAIAAAEKFLEVQGIRLDLDEPANVLRTLIEAEVNRQFPKKSGYVKIGQQ
jgi:hypothetical protein